jgi:hypothetical protein
LLVEGHGRQTGNDHVFHSNGMKHYKPGTSSAHGLRPYHTMDRIVVGHLENVVVVMGHLEYVAYLTGYHCEWLGQGCLPLFYLLG